MRITQENIDAWLTSNLVLVPCDNALDCCHDASNFKKTCDAGLCGARASPCDSLGSLAVGCGRPAVAPCLEVGTGETRQRRANTNPIFFFKQQPGHWAGRGAHIPHAPRRVTIGSSTRAVGWQRPTDAELGTQPRSRADGGSSRP